VPSDISKIEVSGVRSILTTQDNEAVVDLDETLRPLARAFIELAIQMLSDEKLSKAEEEQAA